jgi:hypothetical protein
MTEPMRPDQVEPPAPESEDEPVVLQPTKLIRIASMTRAMLEEARQAPVDEAGRAQLRTIHQRSLEELREVLASDLLDEFNEIILPLAGDEIPSESVLRIAQAQLIGWLEGLFHGIQASLFSQQMAAQAQLAEMQRRQQLGTGKEGSADSTGLYL